MTTQAPLFDEARRLHGEGRLLESLAAIEAGALSVDIPSAERGAVFGVARRLIRAVEAHDRALSPQAAVELRAASARARRSLVAAARMWAVDSSVLTVLLADCGISEWVADEIDQAEQHLVEALTCASTPREEEDAVARALGALVDLLVGRADAAERAEPFAERRVAFERSTGSESAVAMALGQLGTCKAQLGKVTEARAYLGEAIATRLRLFPHAKRDGAVDEWRRILADLDPPP